MGGTQTQLAAGAGGRFPPAHLIAWLRRQARHGWRMPIAAHRGRRRALWSQASAFLVSRLPMGCSISARVTALDDVLDDLTSDKGSCWKCSAAQSGLGRSTATLPDGADLVIATGCQLAAGAGRCAWRGHLGEWSWPGGSAGPTKSCRGSASPVRTARRQPPRCLSRS